ncbi:MAG: hypothetical protein IJP17_03505 [Clostridia bacterium]|nr:hypothetical protein [Clostridia bacterium]
MKSRMRSGYFIAAAVFSVAIAAVLLVLLVGMITSSDEDANEPFEVIYDTPAVSDTDVSESDTSPTDASPSDVQEVTSPTDAVAAQPERKALDLASMATAMNLTRAGMVERFGGNYSEYAAGGSGDYNAYKYDTLGVAFVYAAGDMTSDAKVSWIECDDTITVLGAHEGMTMPEAAQAWGWADEWLVDNAGEGSTKVRQHIEKQSDGLLVKIYTNWHEPGEDVTKLDISISRIPQ